MDQFFLKDNQSPSLTISNSFVIFHPKGTGKNAVHFY